MLDKSFALPNQRTAFKTGSLVQNNLIVDELKLNVYKVLGSKEIMIFYKILYSSYKSQL